MTRLDTLTSNLALESTIDNILANTEKNILTNIKSGLDESRQKLDSSISLLEAEYDKIISDGKKEADKLEKRIIGSADIKTRNKQLVLVEQAVDKVFLKALEQISNISKNNDYVDLIRTLIKESTQILDVSEVVIFTNTKDRDTVESLLSEFPQAVLSPDTFDCIGGIQVKSKDGTMVFNNTLDARIQRMKPLIRKDIAAKFGVGN